MIDFDAAVMMDLIITVCGFPLPHLDTFADDLVVDFFDEVFAVDEFGFGPNPYLVRLEIRHFH